MATTSILLVEDDVTDQLAYTRALSQENYPFTSVIASSLTEARAAMAQHLERAFANTIKVLETEDDA